MGKYNIRIYKSAIRDLEDIVEYINTLSQDAAIHQYDNIIQKIESLNEMTERCPLLKDTQLRLKGYRGLVVDNYIVFYVVKNNIVQIRRIIYRKRYYEWLL